MMFYVRCLRISTRAIPVLAIRGPTELFQYVKNVPGDWFNSDQTSMFLLDLNLSQLPVKRNFLPSKEISRTFLAEEDLYGAQIFVKGSSFGHLEGVGS
jgi:hypothetical protein